MSAIMYRIMWYCYYIVTSSIKLCFSWVDILKPWCYPDKTDNRSSSNKCFTALLVSFLLCSYFKGTTLCKPCLNLKRGLIQSSLNRRGVFTSDSVDNPIMFIMRKRHLVFGYVSDEKTHSCCFQCNLIIIYFDQCFSMCAPWHNTCEHLTYRLLKDQLSLISFW